MAKFTNENIKEHLKMALNPNITKQDHKKASEFLIEYYGEIYDSQSTHLKPTVVALEHLARNKPTKFREWFIRPTIVRLFIFLLGLGAGMLLKPSYSNVSKAETQIEQLAKQ
ncbi:hypothetical protein [Vibrio metschnikovii]|uniref:hypothetical protein n=1 Tax=Vibrio metschnikovii TaxID=28172 RepID=UPI001C2F269B|nr:hypothetical protein [Vibrio metschnikovii]